MPLVTPLDPSFWSTTEKNNPNPNEALWGSPTIVLRSDDANHGQLYWHSGKTNRDYKSVEEARADEALYDSDRQAWNQKYLVPSAMDTATGEQAPIQNPNAPAADTVNWALNQLDPGPLTRPTQKPVATRPGFTNELSSVPTHETVARAPQASPYPAIDGSGVDMNRLRATAAPGGGGGTGPSINTTDPGSPAPTFDRTKIDPILNSLSSYQNEIAALARDNTGQSVAELQLMKAYDIAKQNAAEGLRANTAAALGAARSARNLGDRRLLERQAIGEGTYLGSEAQRQQAAADRQLGYDKAIVRAQEEDYDRRFKLDALKAAGAMGLDQAALETDIGKTDLASATNWINQEFAQLALDKQLDQRSQEALMVHDDARMSQILGFTQAMAAIQYQYDQLSVNDQNEADRLLMQKYGIDQETMLALKQLKAQHDNRWFDFFSRIIGGAGSAATGGAVTALLGGGGGQSASVPQYDLDPYTVGR